MITFKEYLNEAPANTHMSHLEDLVFDMGVEGTRTAINFLRDVRDMLAQGSTNKKGVISLKFDGSPAAFCGVNPENGKFFVAKKGLFNKNPKLYYTEEDVDADTSGDLATKLKIALRECSKLGIKSGIFQGDIMFTKADLKREKIAGVDYITFHPNTIMYAVPADSAMAAKIQKAEIGIAWHTTYTGDSIQSLSAEFGKPIVPLFRKSTSSWMVDAIFEDVTGAATFTVAERQQFDVLLSGIGRKFQRVPSATLNAIHRDSDLLGLVHIYNNSLVRAGKQVTDFAAHVDGLYQYIEARYGAEENKLKTPVARGRVADKRNKVLQFFHTHRKEDIVSIFELSADIARAKMLLVSKLNQASSLGTFLKTRTGFRVTTPEGYVAISERGAVKLVDRMEFSMSNFSPEILKGWER